MIDNSMPKKIEVELPSYKVLLEVLKRTGEFKLVATELGYNLGIEYQKIREEFNKHPKEEWNIYLKSSRNQERNMQVLRLREKGFKILEIVEKLNLTESNVARILASYYDDYIKMRGKTISWSNGQSKKPIEKLTNQLCIKRRLVRLKIKEPVCEICKWDYRSTDLYIKIPEKFRFNCFPIQLHHIDGNNKNNSLENLQFLCPNCHSLQINSFRRKSKVKLILEELT